MGGAQNPTPTFGGVWVDPQGVLRFREADSKAQLSRISALARNTGKDEKLTFVSLPGAMAKAKELSAAGKSLPDEIRYLGGIVQLRYVILLADEKDLVIAGPAETLDTSNALCALGKRTGRPALQFEDLIVALRLAKDGRAPAIGCSLDPPPGAMDRAAAAVRQLTAAPHDQIIDAVAQAIGPQQVTVSGAPMDSRLAMVCLAADYKLKRLSLGVDSSPVSGVGHAIDNSRAAGNRFWFEVSYEPLLVSRDATVFAIRGQRLCLKAGATQFDERGATEKAMAFARQFTQHMSSLCAAIPALADLQNASDMCLLAGLIRHDRLDARIGWDLSWAMTGTYGTGTVSAPRTAESIVCIRSGSVAAGGVYLTPENLLQPNSRQIDEKDTAAPIRQALIKAREAGGFVWPMR